MNVARPIHTVKEVRARTSCAVLGIFAAISASVLLVPADAVATWEDSSEIVGGSAQVLEKGEIAVGIFAPLQYGLTDRLTIASHPVLDLLLLLNFSARYRIATDDSWILSAIGGVKYALLVSETAERPAAVDAGFVFTFFPHRRVATSVGLTSSPWQRASGSTGGEKIAVGATDDGWQWGVAVFFTGHVIIHEKHMLMATTRFLRNIFGRNWEVPTLTCAWVSNHEFFLGDVDVVLGASFGSFKVRDPKIFSAVSKKGYADSFWYPVIDVWKRF